MQVFSSRKLKEAHSFIPSCVSNDWSKTKLRSSLPDCLKNQEAAEASASDSELVPGIKKN
jgi:hypothetical protein